MYKSSQQTKKNERKCYILINTSRFWSKIINVPKIIVSFLNGRMNRFRSCKCIPLAIYSWLILAICDHVRLFFTVLWFYVPKCWVNFVPYWLGIAWKGTSMHNTIDFICLLGVDGSIMIADGKVPPCSHWFLEAYAILEG